jgi:molecular chaperone GrpE
MENNKEEDSINKGLDDLEKGKTHSNEDVKSSVKEKIDFKDKYLRLYAEFENYKKRNSKQLESLKTNTKYQIIDGLIDVLDDVEISKQKLDEAKDENSLKDWSQGSILIYDKIFSKLKGLGLNKVSCESGDNFDSDLHEAINVVDMGDDYKDKVVEVVKNGYTIDNTIVKYPKVIVGK